MIRSDNPEPEITIGNGLITGRLRAGMDGPPYPRNLQTEAADEIKRLRAEYGDLYKRGKAEIERLKAALREVDALAVRHERGAIGKAQKIARAALEGK